MNKTIFIVSIISFIIGGLFTILLNQKNSEYEYNIEYNQYTYNKTLRHNKKHRIMDIVIRTWHEDKMFLSLWFNSYERFFPKHLVKQLFIVLDDESDEDHALAKTLPSYVTIIFEKDYPTLPKDVYNLGDMKGKKSARGWIRSQISNMYIDHYGSAEYIAIFDADSIFHTTGIESLIFRDNKPVFFCSTHREFWMDDIRKKEPLLADVKPFSCMENFPVMVRRDMLPKMRDWWSKVNNGIDFDKIIIESAKSQQWSNFAMLGGYAYAHHRDDYYWAIGGSVYPYATCPEFRVVQHVAYSMDNYFNYPKHSIEFIQHAMNIIAYGSCKEKRACNITLDEDCKKRLAKTNDLFYLLSMEGNNEMMFGRPELLKNETHCRDHVNKRLAELNSNLCENY